MKIFLMLIVIAIMLWSKSASAYTMTVFGVSTWNSNPSTLDSNVGTTGYLIEDFEAESVGALPPGPFASSVISGLTYSNTLSILSVAEASHWDGDQFLVSESDAFTINYALGADSIGIGLGDVGPSPVVGREILVNGFSLGFNYVDHMDFTIGHNIRNAYVRIDTELGDTAITSLQFSSSLTGDGVYYDHIAVNPASSTAVPEPTTIALLGIGLTGLAGAEVRRRRKTKKVDKS